MPQRTCEECGAPFRPRSARDHRCRRHELRGRAHRSPTTRAQDSDYAAERTRVLVPGARCHWCGEPAVTTDHLLAVARGGRHVGNLVPACAHCNFSRQDRLEPPAPRVPRFCVG